MVDIEAAGMERLDDVDMADDDTVDATVLGTVVDERLVVEAVCEDDTSVDVG